MWTLTVALLAGVLAQTESPAPPPAPLPDSILRPAPAEQPAPASNPIRLTSFDPEKTELRWSENRWRLEAGGRVLKDFGRNEADARDAARLLKSLNLNQHGEIGSPRPVMEFWLSNGRAPTGPVSGFRPLPIQLATLKLEQVQGMWHVRDAGRVLFNFGTQEAEARAAVEVIRKHGFNHVGYVGRGAPTMLVFLAGQDTPAPAALTRPQAPAPDKLAQPKPLDMTGPAGSAATSLPFTRQLAQPVGITPHNPSSGVERVPIDWRSVQARREGKDWRLVSGAYVLADFGPNERDARMAQTVVQFFRCTERCLVGQPKPVFDYFLSAGQPPRGSMLGVERVPFHPTDLKLQQNDAGWAIVDPTRTLFRFGGNEAAAKQALKDIQFYRFDTLCRVGRDEGHQLTVLVRGR
jgi:hypothetical protein